MSYFGYNQNFYIIACIGEYLDFYTVNSFCLVFDKMYDVLFNNEHYSKLREVHMQHIAKELFTRVPQLDEECQREMKVKRKDQLKRAPHLFDERSGQAESNWKSQRLIRRRNFFLKYKSIQHIESSFIWFTKNQSIIYDNIRNDILNGIGDILSIEKDHIITSYHNYRRYNKNRWIHPFYDPKTHDILHVYMFSHNNGSRNLHINLPKSAADKLIHCLDDSCIDNWTTINKSMVEIAILRLLSLIIKCESSKLYSFHVLTAIILRNLFKHKCHALARYILFVIDDNFNIINCNRYEFDCNVQFAFKNLNHEYIIYNISKAIPNKKRILKLQEQNKFAINYHNWHMIHKLPKENNNQDKYEMHRQWCQLMNNRNIVFDSVLYNRSAFHSYDEWEEEMEQRVYSRDILWLQHFGSKNCSKYANVDFAFRRCSFVAANYDRTIKDYIDMLGVDAKDRKYIDYYPDWLNSICLLDKTKTEKSTTES